MKKTIFILSAIALVAIGCKQATKKQTVNDSALSRTDSTYYSSIRSSIRQGEALQLHTLYTDGFEYIGYDDNGDDFFITVKKDDEIHLLISDDIHHTVSDLNLNRGDMVEIQWKIDSFRPAGDEELLWFKEYAEKITKTKEGDVSLFKKKYPKPLMYYGERSDYTTSFLDKIYKNVEYYLANSKQDLVKLAISNPKNSLIYSIEEREMDGKRYYAVGIFSEFENHQSIIQWIYLSQDLGTIFEYDLPNDALIKFE